MTRRIPTAISQPRTRKERRRRSALGTRIAGDSISGVRARPVGSRPLRHQLERAAAPRVRRRERLARGESLAPHGGLERVVVAIRALARARRDPLQPCAFGCGVVHAPRVGGREHVADTGLELLALPLPVAGADPLGDGVGIGVGRLGDGGGDAVAHGRDEHLRHGGDEPAGCGRGRGPLARGLGAGLDIDPVEGGREDLGPRRHLVHERGQHLLQRHAAALAPEGVEELVLLVLQGALGCPGEVDPHRREQLVAGARRGLGRGLRLGLGGDRPGRGERQRAGRGTAVGERRGGGGAPGPLRCGPGLCGRPGTRVGVADAPGPDALEDLVEVGGRRPAGLGLGRRGGCRSGRGARRRRRRRVGHRARLGPALGDRCGRRLGLGRGLGLPDHLRRGWRGLGRGRDRGLGLGLGHLDERGFDDVGARQLADLERAHSGVVALVVARLVARVADGLRARVDARVGTQLVRLGALGREQRRRRHVDRDRVERPVRFEARERGCRLVVHLLQRAGTWSRARHARCAAPATAPGAPRAGG